jgi:hypothetical protein
MSLFSKDRQIINNCMKGRLLNKSGRLQLVQSVLSSIPTYYMSVFSISKWTVKKIDRIQRNFLWKGSEDAWGGHCLVNWRRVYHAKFLGGKIQHTQMVVCPGDHLRCLQPMERALQESLRQQSTNTDTGCKFNSTRHSAICHGAWVRTCK